MDSTLTKRKPKTSTTSPFQCRGDDFLATHYQFTKRDKLVLPKLFPRPPPPPKLPEPDNFSPEWHTKANRFAEYALLLYKPWSTRTNLPDGALDWKALIYFLTASRDEADMFPNIHECDADSLHAAYSRPVCSYVNIPATRYLWVSNMFRGLGTRPDERGRVMNFRGRKAKEHM